MKDFVRNYILSQITPTTKSNQISVLDRIDSDSADFGFNYIVTNNSIVFYENTTYGIKFYVYSKTFELIKTDEITINEVHVVGNSLKVDENGNFYLLGYVTPENSTTEVFALVLLNDITKNVAQIRKYYKLSDYGINQEIQYCQKRDGSADYLFVYADENYLKFVELTISVQNGNSVAKWEYQNYSAGSSIVDVGYLFNTEATKILVVSTVNSNTRVCLFNLENFDLSTTNVLTLSKGVEIDKTIQIQALETYTTPKIIVNGISSFVFIDSLTKRLIEYNIKDKFNLQFSEQITTENTSDFVLSKNFVGYITGPAGSYKLTLKKYEITTDEIQISDDYIDFYLTYEEDLSYINKINLIDVYVYNLLSISCTLIETAGTGATTIVKTDSSVSSYTDFNMLVPDYINLYRKDIMYVRHIIFSRKLTNKTILGNQMSAEINVPNSMLNQKIEAEGLVSQTYNLEVLKNQVINKNIYESLYLNFINHINVVDNNFNKNELQADISNLLCESIFDKPKELYNKSPIGFYKVYKTDNSTSIYEIGADAFTQVSSYVYEIDIAINGTNVEKIELLGKDKQTAYVTIPLYTTDGIILIKQNLKFEED